MDKREQVERILHKHSANQMLTEKAVNEILLLFSVSGNEAIQPENKKGEVAVLPSDVSRIGKILYPNYYIVWNTDSGWYETFAEQVNLFINEIKKERGKTDR